MIYRLVRVGTLAVAGMAMFTSQANSQTADTTILGLTFGKPISFPECQPGPLAEKWLKNPQKHEYESPYALTTAAPCYERLGLLPFRHLPIGDETLSLKYPMSIKLALTSYHFIKVKTIAGNLSGIYLTHDGISVQNENLRALMAKFGTPTASEDNIWQNQFGARYTATNAVWKLPNGLTAVYVSRTQYSDKNGQFQIYTEEQDRRDRASSPTNKAVQQGL